jgi:calcineurin-like phosphoesterase family protein
MNHYFTSDNHFFHTNIIKYSNRPFANVDDMNEQMIQRWNDIVNHEDIVWTLGDFSFAKIDKTIQILSRLNGQKSIVFGNHDQEIQKNRKQLLELGLFKEMRDYKELKIDGEHLCLFHFAGRTWNKAHRGSWSLWGHTHNDLAPYGKSVDVGVDSTYVTGKAEYRPFSFDEIKRFMANREIIGHHDR